MRSQIESRSLEDRLNELRGITSADETDPNTRVLVGTSEPDDDMELGCGGYSSSGKIN